MKKNDRDIFHLLIAHSGFRDWVQKPTEESNQFWKKWMDANAEKLDDVKSAREFIEQLNFQSSHLSQSETEEILAGVIANEEPISSFGQKRDRDVSLFPRWVKIAAVFLFAVIAGGLLYGLLYEAQEVASHIIVEWRTVENPKGRKSKITLPDGTLVNLNYESKMIFPKVFEGKIREVKLIGEAFFEVVPNDSLPFVVQAGGVSTEVLGTSFNIRAFEGEPETDISVVTGKVKINHLSDGSKENETHLSPGEQLSYNKNTGQTVKSNFEVSRTIAWKEGIIVFKDAGLPEFIEQLEKWYGVDFQVFGSPSKAWKINGRYENQKLDEILTGLNFVYGLEYQIQGRNVIINFK